MAVTGSVAVQTVVGFLTAPDGGISPLVAQLANDTGVALAPIPAASIVNQNVPFALAEKAQAVKYPAMYVYTDRVRNLLKEKFRVFSGKSADGYRSEGFAGPDRGDGGATSFVCRRVTQVLDANRGSWGQGAFYTGGYEVTFDPVQHGGQELPSNRQGQL